MKAHLRAWGVMLAAVSIAALLSACPPAINPVVTAQTADQKAYALYGTYVIAQGKAAELVQESTVPDKVKDTLRAADKAAYPVAESLVDAANLASDIRDKLDKCPTDPDPNCKATNEQKLANALTNLSSIYFSAQPVLLNLINAVKEAK